MRALLSFVILGSGLLFLLQPLVGRLLLPMHGGGFQVWTTCMLFFQVALLAGYAYAHWLLPRHPRLHRALVLLSLCCAPLWLSLIPARAGSVADMLLALTLGVALPFVVLATTSIVAQVRAASLPGAEDPYPLYAYSNLGSLIGLLSYPLLLEPVLGLVAQRTLWALLYVAYAVMAYQSTPRSWPVAAQDEPSERIASTRMLYWILIGASACGVLFGLTNVLSLGAGSIPLVWVLTLAAYLLGFVAAFARESGRLSFLRAYWPETTLLALFCYHESRWLSSVFSERGLLALQVVCLFWITWGANAELFRTRPSLRGLTTFYLCIAAGGAIGGVLCGVVAPLALSELHEYPIALLLLGLTLAWGNRAACRQWLFARTSWAQSERLHRGRWLRALLFGVFSIGAIVPFFADKKPSHALRNFYGLYAIWDHDRGKDSDGLTRSIRILSHNGTNHGLQSQRPDERCLPTGYFHRKSPLGELLSPPSAPRRAAVIGLGTGTIATYFDAQDELTFYELDADTRMLARKYFSFLEGCKAKPRIVIGDARLELARDRTLQVHSLDLLIVDAFSGDSIPFHLLTREALALYVKKLKPSGVLIFHISSRFYELWPTIATTARSLGLRSAQHTRQQTRKHGPLAWSSQYAVATRDARFIDQLGSRGWIVTTSTQADLWTDNRVSLLPALIRRLYR